MAPADSSLVRSGQSVSDILIVGGGVMGLWAAVKAADAGLSVTLVDAAAIGSGASGGLLGALFPWMPDRWDAKKQYQFDALVSLPHEIARLEGETGLTANFRRAGRIVPLPKPHLRDIALRHSRDAESNWHQGQSRFHWHIRDDQPAGAYINPAASEAGYIFDTLAARVEPRALLLLLKAWLLRQSNVRIMEHARLARLDARVGRAEVALAPHPAAATFSPLKRGEGDFGTVGAPSDPSPRLRGEGWGEGQPHGTTITFSHILIAAGVESFPILRPLMPPLPKPLGQGVKGQAALLKADLDPTLPVVFLDGVYVVPHEGGFAAVGSTSENTYVDPYSTDTQLDAVIEKARILIPALRDAPVVERWAGIRPKSIGRDPLVGSLADHPNVIALTGGFKISFGMAHRLAQSALDLVLGSQHAPLPENFTLAGQLAREFGA